MNTVGVTTEVPSDIKLKPWQTGRPDPNPALAGSRLRPRPPPSGQIRDETTKWLDRCGATESYGGVESTAQVEPFDFCRHIFDHLRTTSSLKYYRGAPARIAQDWRSQSLESISIVSTARPNMAPFPEDPTADSDHSSPGSVVTLPCHTLVLATGPWTAALASKLGLFAPLGSRSLALPIGNLPGHAILLRPKQPIPATAVFATINGARSGELTSSPEIFPRPNGLVYVAGENGGVPIVAYAHDSEQLVKEPLIRKLVKASGVLSKPRLCRGMACPDTMYERLRLSRCRGRSHDLVLSTDNARRRAHRVRAGEARLCRCRSWTMG